MYTMGQFKMMIKIKKPQKNDGNMLITWNVTKYVMKLLKNTTDQTWAKSQLSIIWIKWKITICRFEECQKLYKKTNKV